VVTEEKIDVLTIPVHGRRRSVVSWQFACRRRRQHLHRRPDNAGQPFVDNAPFVSRFMPWPNYGVFTRWSKHV